MLPRDPGNVNARAPFRDPGHGRLRPSVAPGYARDRVGFPVRADVGSGVPAPVNPTYLLPVNAPSHAGEGPGPDRSPDAPRPDAVASGEASPLDGLVVVLHRTQDLVNIALVVRAMKNMGLKRLRLVAPQEFDPHRVEGIAHGTEDLVGRVEFTDSLEEAIADAVLVVGTSARRRASRQVWSTPEEAAPRLVREALEAASRDPEGTVALVFGPEDRGLSNLELDRCQEVLCIPTSPEHPSLNLAHATLLVLYELRKAADRAVGLPERDLSTGKDETAPPATAGELERFFEVWERALERVGFFHHLDPEPKMRTFRSLYQRASLDRREAQLLEAVAWEIVHYERRLRIRLRNEVEKEPGADDREPAAGD